MSKHLNCSDLKQQLDQQELLISQLMHIVASTNKRVSIIEKNVPNDITSESSNTSALPTPSSLPVR
ncbi:hypothetical protein CEY16_08730 [Halalkalibacillus sediminis]|uniref:Uncharacterized protein n=1 Tax=Halalkalibacillus sediminis TaxID=2018042 RepID=A0A2I0QUH0_9BACI|nr:hypothetical protein [Halalkalibacillus sediminis]PKR77995.1 hypothetical protein CEY16_08730 [Halalkalibacillus sediminis]